MTPAGTLTHLLFAAATEPDGDALLEAASAWSRLGIETRRAVHQRLIGAQEVDARAWDLYLLVRHAGTYGADGTADAERRLRASVRWWAALPAESRARLSGLAMVRREAA